MEALRGRACRPSTAIAAVCHGIMVAVVAVPTASKAALLVVCALMVISHFNKFSSMASESTTTTVILCFL